MKPEEQRYFTEGLFKQIQITTDYLKHVVDAVGGVLNKNDRENTIYGLFCRAVCFSKTVGKCNEASDFQSLQHINRALIEVASDLIFLLHDASRETDLKIKVWEESAKLKAAILVIEYYKDKNLSLPSECRHQEGFVKKFRQTIEGDRQKWWGKNFHPNRWTGNNLLIDVQEADRLEGSVLEEIYQVEYRRMNWFAHGSGLTGMRYFKEESFLNLCGLSFSFCQKLSLLIAKIVLKAFGYFEKDVYKSRWEEVNRNIESFLHSFLPKITESLEMDSGEALIVGAYSSSNL
jgi:hypothetical protein